MKTERLFNDNPYLEEFNAKVVEVIPFNDKYGVVLDKTAFYPEGGGQPSDTGHLNDVNVLQVIDKDGQLLHIVDKPLESETVKGLINWPRRFDHMQQHTGQHILSECFEKLLNGSTDSFHLGKDIVSIEINIENFNDSDMPQIENMANAIIYSNLPVTAKIVTDEELQSIPLRKKPKVSENIRIVEVKEFDYSPCGGTHVGATGEVGMIKIINWEKCKGGFRFTFVCGYRALKDYSLQNSITRALGEKLSVRDFDIVEAVGKLQADYRIAVKQLSAATQELIKYEAEQLLAESNQVGGLKLISKILEGRSMNDAKLLAQYLTQSPGTIVLLACRNETAQVLFTRSEDASIDMNNLLKKVFPIIDGKGGGNARTAQGGGDKVDKLDDFLSAAANMLNI
ncbi:MAG TPA: DHHA1 domain-containing protein [Clostridia bacterium]|nr:DHHA1 domain-containing protein [Clostridia bacterium]